jgi:hypothetical protein
MLVGVVMAYLLAGRAASRLAGGGSSRAPVSAFQGDGGPNCSHGREPACRLGGMQHTPDALTAGLSVNGTAGRNAFGSIVPEPGGGD